MKSEEKKGITDDGDEIFCQNSGNNIDDSTEPQPRTPQSSILMLFSIYFSLFQVVAFQVVPSKILKTFLVSFIRATLLDHRNLIDLCALLILSGLYKSQISAFSQRNHLIPLISAYFIQHVPFQHFQFKFVSYSKKLCFRIVKITDKVIFSVLEVDVKFYIQENGNV